MKKVQFNPNDWELLNNWVLIEVEKIEEKTAGGIYLTDSSKEREQHGRIYGKLVKMSDGAFPYPEFPKKPELNSVVSFDRHAGKYADDEGVFRFLSDMDIIAFKPTTNSTGE
jgi:co-chaperonin GroES (HSP10)